MALKHVRDTTRPDQRRDFLLPTPIPFQGIVVPLSDNKNAIAAFEEKRIYVYEKIHIDYAVGAVHLHELRHLARLSHLYIYRLSSQIKRLLKSTAVKRFQGRNKVGILCPSQSRDETMGWVLKNFKKI